MGESGFIPNITDREASLVHLTGKDVPFGWSDQYQTVYNVLCNMLKYTPILVCLAETSKYFLDTDVSNFIIAGVSISQLQNCSEHVIVCALWLYIHHSTTYHCTK